MAKQSSNSLAGNIIRDGSRTPIQVAGSFQTNDSTGTPQTSPLTVSTSVVTLVVPDNAIQVSFLPLSADMRVSELVGMGQYDVVRQNTKEVISCAKMQNIYVKRDAAADVSLNFKFILA